MIKLKLSSVATKTHQTFVLGLRKLKIVKSTPLKILKHFYMFTLHFSCLVLSFQKDNVNYKLYIAFQK